MAFRKVTLDRVPSQGEVLTITKSGLYFSSSFIKGNNLETKESISFFFDDEDPYMLGFEFYDESGSPDSLILMAAGRNSNSLGRTTKAS